MGNPHRAGDTPVSADLEEGKVYAWCACGLSKNQPFCDGSHKETEHTPSVFTAEKSGKHYMCMCKATGNQPFCDGTHSK